MKEVKRVPKLRFPDFLEEWKRLELGNTCDVKTGNKDTQNKKEDGKYPFFVRSNTVERINSYSFDGEAILTSGDGVGVGKNFHYINAKFDYHQRVYALINFKKEFSGKFIFHVFSEKFYRRVLGLSAKNSVDSVRMDFITKMKIGFPSLPEQQKIATFLSSVDKKIDQLQQKKSLLEQYKKGVMQKIFSQKLRFKDDNGNNYSDWEEKKFDNVFESISTKKHQIKNSEILDEGDFKVIDQGQSAVAGYSNNKSKLMLDVPVIIFGDHTTIIKYVIFPFIIGADGTKILKASIKSNLSYLYYYIAFYNVEQQGYRRHFSLLRNLKIELPVLEEQAKIAHFLSAIDAKIALVNTQIENTQQFKVGLLQQMFV